MPLDPGVRKVWGEPFFLMGVFFLTISAACILFLTYVDLFGWRGDPNPNPVGVGILLWLVTPPGVIMAAVGLSQAIDRDRMERRKRGPA